MDSMKEIRIRASLCDHFFSFYSFGDKSGFFFFIHETNVYILMAFRMSKLVEPDKNYKREKLDNFFV